MLMILRIRLIELKTRLSSKKNRNLLSLMQVSILENGRRIVKRFKILLTINLRSTKLRNVLIEKLLDYAIHQNRQKETSYEFKECFTTHLD